MLGYACAAVALSASVALDPRGWYPFGPAKWAAVSVALGVLLVALVLRRTVAVPRRAGLLGGAFLLTVVIASALGDDPLYRWIGTPERHLGALTWAAFAVAFLAGAQLGVEERVVVVRATAASAAFVGVYSIIELVAGAPIALATDTVRLGGPFGSAAYLGAATCLLVPISAGLALDHAGPRSWRVVGFVGATTGMVAAVEDQIPQQIVLVGTPRG